MSHSQRPEIFDRRLFARRRARALERLAATSGDADFLLANAATDLGERLAAVSRDFPLAVDLGGHRGHVSAALAASGRVGAVLRADLLVEDRSVPGAALVADDAFPPFADASLDLVASALSLHLVNDLPGALIQIRRTLRPDGLFLANLLGGDTLFELKDAFMLAELETLGGATPHVVPFADTRALGALLQRAGFALPVADVDRLTVRYADMFALMRDLRAMGAANILADRSRAPLSRATLARAAEIYAERHADPDGRIRATFDLVSLSGWAPHESQQKPLKPGSARTSLADALSVIDAERKNNDPQPD
ncbi:methyltransferase domain-containing protein [Stappia sp. 28M-7]|uniref:methyltransferase domain-containing protein n=1 Tax=Stappia sp. 28M-7 TaxID=2762596 RepID=UPI00163C55D9|nr:methyltransferase domain-containing protein [Stappia sp. 28M-7]